MLLFTKSTLNTQPCVDYGGCGRIDGIGGISGGGWSGEDNDDDDDSEEEASCNLLLITVKEGGRHFTKSTLERDDEESFWSLAMIYKCDQEKRWWRHWKCFWLQRWW